MGRLRLDHLAVAGETLEDAVRYVESSLGVSMVTGGEHERFATHNQLLGLADNLYLEAIAINPEAIPRTSPRWFNLDHFSGPPRLHGWICETNDISGWAPHAGRCLALRRNQLAWDMLVPETGVLPFDNLFPSILRWRTRPTPGDTLAPSGCRLQHLAVHHPLAHELRVALAIADERVTFSTGPVPSLVATFETRYGLRTLSSTGE